MMVMVEVGMMMVMAMMMMMTMMAMVIWIHILTNIFITRIKGGEGGDIFQIWT